MTNSQVAAKVRKHKEQHPELYCSRCLWKTNGGDCPRHAKPLPSVLLDEDPDFWKGIGLKRERPNSRRDPH